MTKKEDSLLSKSKREIEQRMTEIIEKAHNYIDIETLLTSTLPETEVEEYFKLEDKLNDLV